MMLRFACSERNGSVVIAVPPDHLRRRVKGSPYLYWRGALRYSKYRIQEGSSKPAG
jgi:hypothetical protein